MAGTTARLHDQEIEAERAALDAPSSASATRLRQRLRQRRRADCRPHRAGRPGAPISPAQQPAPAGDVALRPRERARRPPRAFAANGCSRGSTVISGGGGGHFGHAPTRPSSATAASAPSGAGGHGRPTRLGTFRALRPHLRRLLLPISFATTAERFATTAGLRRALPGNAHRAYVHATGGNISRPSRSPAILPFLATAFRYRLVLRFRLPLRRRGRLGAPTAEPPALPTSRRLSPRPLRHAAGPDAPARPRRPPGDLWRHRCRPGGASQQRRPRDAAPAESACGRPVGRTVASDAPGRGRPTGGRSASPGRASTCRRRAARSRSSRRRPPPTSADSCRNAASI